MNTKQQGDIGVSAAILHYTKQGCKVSIPFTESTRYDLIVDRDNILARVQCKTSGFVRNGSYNVQLATSGGNQSWNHQPRALSRDDCDLLFVYTLNGSMYEFPPDIFNGKRMLSLCKKYDQFLLQ